MRKSIYNNDDEQYKNVIESLKQLPREDAPPDFEMNLQRRINGLKYEKERRPFWYFIFDRPLIPAAAATALVLIFLAISMLQKDLPTQLPKPDSLTAQVEKAKPALPEKEKPAVSRQKSSDNLALQSPSAKQPAKAVRKSTHETAQDHDVIASNENLRRQLRELDLNGFGSNLDENLRAKPSQSGLQDYGNPGSNVSFDQFQLAPAPDRQMNLLRSKTDSIRKFWLKRLK